MPEFLKNDYLLAAAYILGALVLDWLLRKWMLRAVQKAAEKLRSDATQFQFLTHTVRAIVLGIGFTLALSQIEAFKSVTQSVLAGAGVLALAVGFASQQALGAVISGLFIILFKPFRIKDRLTIQGKYTGVVEDITLRHTVLRDIDGQLIIVPNTVMNTEILVNEPEDNTPNTKFLTVYLSPQADLVLAKGIVINTILADPNYLAEADLSNLVRVSAVMPGYISLLIKLRAANQKMLLQLYYRQMEEIKLKLEAANIQRPDVMVNIK